MGAQNREGTVERQPAGVSCKQQLIFVVQRRLMIFREEERIDLNSFDDFIRQVMDPEGERIGLPTLFFPMQRVERIALDEPRGSIASLSERFEQRVGRSLRDYLALFV